jgi:hypothetical protein
MTESYFFDEDQEFDLDKFLDDELKLTKKGTPRKRKPKEPRVYFTQDTEDAILQYLITEDLDHRNKIYNERIAYAFYKLTENIIHTFKFYYTDTDTIEELKYEVISFLLEKLSLFNHSKSVDDRLNKIINKEFGGSFKKGSFREYTGDTRTVTQEQINTFIATLEVSSKCSDKICKLTPPKAFSYFGTIAKRYLINYNDNNYTKLQNKVSMDDVDEENNILIDKSYDKTDLNEFLTQYIAYFDKNMYDLFPKQKDAQTADAIVELFRKRESLEIFNKKALYIYIREITDVDTPQITKIIKKLKDLYLELYNEYYRNGFVKI